MPVIAGVLLAAGGALAAATAALPRTDSSTYSFPAVREVVVEAGAGTVGPVPSDGPDAVVTTTRHWSFRVPERTRTLDAGVPHARTSAGTITASLVRPPATLRPARPPGRRPRPPGSRLSSNKIHRARHRLTR